MAVSPASMAAMDTYAVAFTSAPEAPSFAGDEGSMCPAAGVGLKLVDVGSCPLTSRLRQSRLPHERTAACYG